MLRSLVVIVAAAVLAGLLLQPWRGPAGQRLLLPWRVARLHLVPPDAQLVMPVEGVRVRRVANTWQAPRSGGRRHEGTDIFAPRGTPVRSATAGIVIRIAEQRLGGQSVWVAGAGGRRYYYTHLNGYAPDLRVGQTVTPATLLGYVGNTGNARTTPPHLHFGVYTPGGATNPLPLLVDRGARPAAG